MKPKPATAQDRKLLFVFRPQLDQDCEDQNHKPSIVRRLRIGSDPKSVPFPGDFVVRRITKAEVQEHFNEENQRSKMKARGASKKLIELLAAGTDLPKNPRAAAALAANSATSPNSSRLPTSLLELARQSEELTKKENDTNNNNNNNSIIKLNKSLGNTAELNTSNNDIPHVNENENNNENTIQSAAQKVNNALEQSLSDYDRPKAGNIAIRCAPTQNKNFFRESYAHDYTVVGATNTGTLPQSKLQEPCKAAEKAIDEFFKKHLNNHCKSLWDGEDATVVMQTSDHLQQSTSNNSKGSPGHSGVFGPESSSVFGDRSPTTSSHHASGRRGSSGGGAHNNAGSITTVPPAPSQLLVSMLFPEYPNAEEEQLDPPELIMQQRRLSRRGSVMSRRGSIRLQSRSNSFKGGSMAELAALVTEAHNNSNNNSSSATHLGAGQNNSGGSAGRLRSNSSGSNLNSLRNTPKSNDLTPQLVEHDPPPHPHEKHLLRLLLNDLLDEKKQREFPGVTTRIYVSAVMLEEPEEGDKNKLETGSAMSGVTAKSGSAVKINVEDLLSGHYRTSRYVGDWAGNVKDLEEVHQQATQQMQALNDAPSVEKMREDCKVLQMLRALDDADAEKLIEEFKKFDQDGNGVLDPTEIREFFMEAFGYWIDDDELEQFFKVADQDNSGSIDIPEFLALFEGQRPKKATGSARTLKLPSSKLVEGLKALARIKRVKKADELGMRPPTLTVSGAKDGVSGGSSSALGGSSKSRSECKILNMLHALDDHDADKLVQEFKKFDADGNSELDRTEIREFFMEAFSYWVTEEEMDQFFAIADTDNSGTIDIPEFLALFETKRDKRSFASPKPVPGVTSAVSNKIKSGLDALARIKRIRKGGASGGAKDDDKLLSRHRSGSVMGGSAKSLLAGAKIAYRSSNSTNPFEVGVYNMKMLNVTSEEDIEWLERRLSTMYQKSCHSIDPFEKDFGGFSAGSHQKPRGHWIINISLCQSYSEGCGLGLQPRAGTMRFMLMNATTKRMNQLNFELRRMLNSIPRTIYDKFPPDIDAQLQLDSLDSRGRLKKSVLNMVHLLRASLHQKKISRLVTLVISNETGVNSSLGVLGNLMRTGIETTNLAYDKAVEDSLVNLVALRMQLERERNDAHFAVEAFHEIHKSKIQAKGDIELELKKQTNAVYRQLKRAEDMNEIAGVNNNNNNQASSGERHRSITFVAPSNPGSPRSPPSIRIASTSSNRSPPPSGGSMQNSFSNMNMIMGNSVSFLDNLSMSTTGSPNHAASLSMAGPSSNRENALMSAVGSEREKANKNHSIRLQQLRDVESVLGRARERFERARRNVENARIELPRRKAHWEFVLKSEEAAWKEEESNMEKSKNEQLASWMKANVEQRDAKFALSILPEVPDEDTVLESVYRQATNHRSRAIDQQLAKTEQLRKAHEKHLADSRKALAKLQKVADIVSGKFRNLDTVDAWEDDEDDDTMNDSDHHDGDEETKKTNDNNLSSPTRNNNKEQHYSPSFHSPSHSTAAKKILKLQEQQRKVRQQKLRRLKSQTILPAELQGLDYDHRRELFARTALFFEASCLLYRVSQTCRNQNEEMKIKFDRGEFHEATVRESNRVLTIQPPQAMLVAQLTTPPTCLQAVLRDALDGAFAALHQLGSTFGRNAALYHADAMKGNQSSSNNNNTHAVSSNNQFNHSYDEFGLSILSKNPEDVNNDHQNNNNNTTNSRSQTAVSVAPLKMTAAMKRGLYFVSKIRNDPSVKIDLTAEDAERLELLTFFSSNYSDEHMREEKYLLKHQTKKSGVFFSNASNAKSFRSFTEATRSHEGSMSFASKKSGEINHHHGDDENAVWGSMKDMIKKTESGVHYAESEEMGSSSKASVASLLPDEGRNKKQNNNNNIAKASSTSSSVVNNNKKPLLTPRRPSTARIVSNNTNIADSSNLGLNQSPRRQSTAVSSKRGSVVGAPHQQAVQGRWGRPVITQSKTARNDIVG